MYTHAVSMSSDCLTEQLYLSALYRAFIFVTSLISLSNNASLYTLERSCKMVQKNSKEGIPVHYAPVHITPGAELEARAAKLQSLMLDSGLDGAIIVQNADLFYFAGTVQRAKSWT